MAISDGDHLTETSNAAGYEKIAIFNYCLALSRKWYEIEPYLLRNANRNSHAVYQMVLFLMNLSDPNLDFKVVLLFILK